MRLSSLEIMQDIANRSFKEEGVIQLLRNVRYGVNNFISLGSLQVSLASQLMLTGKISRLVDRAR